MYRCSSKIFNAIGSTFFKSAMYRNFLTNSHVKISEIVRFGLETNKPVIALESTIITHGMPFPDNIKCALEVEQIVKEQGAIPATIAVLHGNVKVGLTEDEITSLGDIKNRSPIKTSRRDLSYVVSSKQNGGTTVSGTLVIANKAGIPIFATGGIGGVHRGAQETFDISADLTELGKCNVAVVSSGVKSILDIPKTLEYLETQGVFVATFGNTNDFPAFYSKSSGTKAPYYIKTIEEAAQIIKCNKDLNMQSGMLFAVPIPDEYALAPEKINNVIEEALKKVGEIKGKNVTPYLLSQVAKLTDGKSLQSNIALIKNNAKIAADIAVALANLDLDGDKFKVGSRGRKLEGRPVVIGGSVLDCNVTLETAEIKLDGRIYDGRFSYTAGGVGRNICECLYKLGFSSNFLSVVGEDDQGKLLKSLIPSKCRDLVKIAKYNTAQAIVIFDNKGDCKFLMGDMKIHKQLTPQMIIENEDIIKSSPLIIMDANLSLETITEMLNLADKHDVPVFFEPTDLAVSTKPFETNNWNSIRFISPNLNELRRIASFLKLKINHKFCSNIEEAANISQKLLEHIENVIVTLGPEGVVIARRGLATDPLLIKSTKDSQEHVRYYPSIEVSDLVNVSGAGDCFTSGFAAGLISLLPEEVCISIGFAAANLALHSQSAVPEEMFDRRDKSWTFPAPYEILY